MRYAPMYHPVVSGGLWFWDFGMSLFWLVFVILVVTMIVRAMRHHHAAETDASHTDPLDIAKGRYARGDITKDEFDQIKKDLSAK
ncbi:MAG TPA: SHOCT domain-containing protein [Candidatus Acidoferrum sp.]|nr:SHOCT domain-containing protein [Candidatus Acidoferrum sp.]